MGYDSQRRSASLNPVYSNLFGGWDGRTEEYIGIYTVILSLASNLAITRNPLPTTTGWQNSIVLTFAYLGILWLRLFSIFRARAV